MLLDRILRQRYQIIKKIGGGSFGDTYLAIDRDYPGERHCVVKHLSPKNTAPQVIALSKELFKKEAKCLSHLGEHNQIPRLYAYFEENEQFYLVQEYIQGQNLTKEFKPGTRWSEEATIKLLKELLEILSFVHQKNTIHRDIKPANIMRRDSDGKLVLIDFGAVKEVLSVDENGQTSIVIGTLGYMDPEQARGKPQQCSDVYSVGILGIQGLTGLALRDLLEDLEQKLDKLKINRQLKDFLSKMISFQHRSRYKDATESLQALIDMEKQHSFDWKKILALTVTTSISSLLIYGQNFISNKLQFSSTSDPVPRFAQVQNVPEGTFSYGGSTTWAPIRGTVDLEIQKARPEFRLNYVQPEGVVPSSQSGLEMLAQGKVAFSLASRLPSTKMLQQLEENGIQVKLVPVAESFEVVAVNWSLPISQLTIEQLNAINKSKINNWREVEGPDLPIQRFDRTVNANFLDTRPDLTSGNTQIFTTPSEAVHKVAETPGGIYIHTSALLVPQCSVKILAIVNSSGQTIAPYEEPLVPPSQCPAKRNKVNIDAFKSGDYPNNLENTLYVVIKQNGKIEQQVGEAYKNFLLSNEGQALLEKNGYLSIQR